MTSTENHRRKALIINGLENWEFVSVIIPVYNDYKRLKLCLAALERQSYPRERFEIVVVDNGSEEKFCLESKKNSKVIFCNEEEPGSYNARNRGIFISRGEILAFTDSDCLPDKDWISNGVMELRTSYNIGLVGGAIDFLFKDPERPSVWELYDSITYLQQQKSIEVFKFAATANMFTTKKVFERVGLFDSKLKSGGDREWGERVTHAGHELKFASYAIVNHPARSTFQELIKRDIRIFGGSHQLRIRKM
jgi:glycosyltransferase involved in cell wall biosynthesis